MKIVTTNIDGREAFSAQVESNNSTFMVYGFVPPAPKSSYLMVGEGGIAIPDVPADVAKIIYTKLKRGEVQQMPVTPTSQLISVNLLDYVKTLPSDVRPLIRHIDQSNDTHITLHVYLPGETYQLVLYRYKHKESCVGTIHGSFGKPIELEANGDLLPIGDWNTWHFTPNHYKVDLRDVYKGHRSVLSKIIQSLAPYLLQHQYDYVPHPETVFKGYSGRTFTPRKLDLDALKSYLQGTGTAIYVGTKLYSGTKEFPKTVTTYYPSIDKNILVIACSNIENGYEHPDILGFVYGDVIGEDDIPGTIYGKLGIGYLCYMPNVFLAHYSDVYLDTNAKVTGRPIPASTFKRRLVYENSTTPYKWPDGTHPFDKFLGDDRFYSLVEAIQNNAR